MVFTHVFWVLHILGSASPQLASPQVGGRAKTLKPHTVPRQPRVCRVRKLCVDDMSLEHG